MDLPQLLEMSHRVCPTAHVVVIGTKADLRKPHHVTTEEAEVSKRRVRGGGREGGRESWKGSDKKNYNTHVLIIILILHFLKLIFKNKVLTKNFFQDYMYMYLLLFLVF